MLPASLGDGRAAALTADCSACTGLCCVLLPYRRDAGFGADKPGQVPCPNLLADDRCGIHADLVEKGWSGCATFDCFGAGQQVTAVTYEGRSWREVEDLGEMAAVLSAQRLLHEMLLHLEEVSRRSPDPAAAALAEQLSSGILLTRVGEGHLGFNKGNACIDDAVEAYFVDGTVPDGDITCE